MAVTTDSASTELRRAREAAVLQHLEAENNHDVEAAVASFARPHYDVVVAEAEFNGADEVRALLEMLFTAFPDVHGEVRKLHHADEAVFCDVLITGTHLGDYLGVPPTGQPVRFRLASVFDFQGDQLVNETIYYDNATVLRQMGTLPG
jgi:steroid delta-isomerase-like uncharacterized protein